MIAADVIQLVGGDGDDSEVAMRMGEGNLGMVRGR